mgnify:CR=1 FL=1
MNLERLCFFSWVTLFTCVLCMGFFIKPYCTIAASEQSLLEIQKAYVAYYGRPADPGGQEYWANLLEQAGGSIEAIIEAFGNSQEFLERFGSLSKEELINNIYRNLFNRDAEPEGLNFYLGKLRSGEMTLQSICLNILYGAQNEDRIVVQNKVKVAQYFTEELRRHPQCTYIGNEAAERGKQLLSYVNETEGSVQAAKIAVDYGYCGVVRCPQDPKNSQDALSVDQKAFIASKGNPIMFQILFASEKINNETKKIIYDGTVRRLDTWFYNSPIDGFQMVTFDNGFFVEQKTIGPYVEGLVATQWSPAQFTPCSTKSQVEQILGPPTCVLQSNFGNRLIKAMRYNPSQNQAAGTVYTENDLVVLVEAGYAVAAPGAGTDLCATTGK